MVFEVDNTTEQLIHELQKSIEDTIAALEKGQRDIRGMIETVRDTCEDSATADQADDIAKQLSGLRTEQRKGATSQQVIALGTALEAVRGQAQQELNETAEVKEQIAELGQSVQSGQRAMVDAQEKAREQLAQQISEQINKSVEDKLRRLQELSNQLTELSSDLTGRLDTLVSSSSSAAKTAAGNQAMLAAITAYLSLPGYKRFFKGMEVVQYETSQ